MNGREENSILINKKINEYLDVMPKPVSDWNSLLIIEDKTENTRLEYVRVIYRFLKSISYDIISINMSEISKNQIVEFLKNIHGQFSKETSNSYQLTTWYALNSFTKFLVSENYLIKNFLNDIPKPKNRDIQKRDENKSFLTKFDFQKIINTADKGLDGEYRICGSNVYANIRDKAILLLFMTTGIRCTALEEINVEDIDLTNGVLTVIDKGEKLLKYVLPEITINAICDYYDQRWMYLINKPDTNALFLSANGKRLSNRMIAEIVKKYSLKAIGKPLSPHKLRAGFCTVLYDETHDIEMVRRAVGHSKVSTTQRYIRSKNDAREKSAAIFDNVFGG